MNTNKFVPFITKLCQATDSIILPLFDTSDLEVEDKADLSLVTKADKDCEVVLREMILKEFPTHGIIGEEFGNHNTDAELVWTLDPIDGTKSFVAGVPLFTTLISLIFQGAPVLGAIYQPVLKKLCIGTGAQTSINGKQVHVSRTSELSKSVVLSSGIADVSGSLPQNLRDKLINGARTFRTWGDGWGYMMVASGRADLMIDGSLKLWDIAPMIPIIKGAGGICVSLSGGDPIKDLSAVATNSLLYQNIF
jgi:histidinol phosphatase-like enzyme (inositol monophosphatase family)